MKPLITAANPVSSNLTSSSEKTLCIHTKPNYKTGLSEKKTVTVA